MNEQDFSPSSGSTEGSGDPTKMPPIVLKFCASMFMVPVILFGLIFAMSNKKPLPFSDIIGAPQPSSVIIIHPDEGGFWKHGADLHFKIDPAQLDAIISSVGYRQVDKNKFLWNSPGNPPSWWKPETMSGGPVYYARFYGHGVKNGWSRWMLVNSAHNEVYAEN